MDGVSTRGFLVAGGAVLLGDGATPLGGGAIDEAEDDMLWYPCKVRMNE